MSDKHWSGTHNGPRSSKPKYGSAEKFYVFEHTNGKDTGAIYMRVISRKPKPYTRNGFSIVRYDGMEYMLHPADTLGEFVQSLDEVTNFDASREFDPTKDQTLRYIKYFDKNEKCWEAK